MPQENPKTSTEFNYKGNAEKPKSKPDGEQRLKQKGISK